ncbi:MAG: hypothetical protein Q8P04_00280, partial [bacterium]|nr:hypothetical protein [bacterium]
MQKSLSIIVYVGLFATLALVLTLAFAANPAEAAKPVACTTIQDGTLLTSDNKVITPGFDEWGYNYQARL